MNNDGTTMNLCECDFVLDQPVHGLMVCYVLQILVRPRVTSDRVAFAVHAAHDGWILCASFVDLVLVEVVACNEERIRDIRGFQGG